MGFLDNVVKGLGDDAAGGLSDLLKGQGGVGGLAEKFGQAGLGDVIGSWVGTAALDKLPEAIFRRAFKITMTLLALQIVYGAFA